MDDATALQNLNSAQAADATLFDIRPAVRWSQWNRDGNLGQKKWTGENPPAGAIITYYLKSQPPGEVNLTISDNAGHVVRRMRRVADDAGLNRVAWDLRPDPPQVWSREEDVVVAGRRAASRQRPTHRSRRFALVARRRLRSQNPINRPTKVVVAAVDVEAAGDSKCCPGRTRLRSRSTESSSPRRCRSSSIPART
jgi:hypothetical protein